MSLLNKLTPEKYDKILGQILNLPIGTELEMEAFIDLLVTKDSGNHFLCGIPGYTLAVVFVVVADASAGPVMVRWMCGVSLKDRKRSEDLCNLLGINCVADVVRRGRLRWFGHLERKSVDDWVSACRGLVVEGTRGRGRSRKTWEQCVRDDMKLLGLHPEWAVFRDMWRDLIWGKRLTLA